MATHVMATNVDACAKAARHHAAGQLSLAAGKLREAVASFEEALRIRPDFGDAYNDLGIAWHHLGEWARAEGCYRQVTRLMPSCGAAYNNLGTALRGQGKWAEAFEAFEQAVRLEPNNPDLALSLGVNLHEQGKLKRAVGCYRHALRLKPGHAAASTHLARALIEQGLLGEALEQLRETLKFHPDHALAYYLLSEMVAEGRYQFAPEDFSRMKAIMASSRSSDSERSLCTFALAKVLNQLGRHDEAFGYFQQGNNLNKRLLKERNVCFDAQGHEALIERVIEFYDQAYFEGVRGWGTDTDLPVFIIGMPRSGSTLVEQILASHPQVIGVGESGEIHQFLKSGTGAKLYGAPLLPDQSAASKLATDYLQWLAKAGPGAARVTNKTLQNFLHLGVIATLFPRARIIHCRRDPLDTCLSCYFTNFRNVAFDSSLEDIGAYYRSYAKVMAHWSRVLPLRIHEVCYEELIHNQEAVTRKLLAYCGLDWNEDCLAFFNTRRVVRTPSAIQVRRRISAQAIGRWKYYRHHLGPLFKALGWSVAREIETSTSVAGAGGVNLNAQIHETSLDLQPVFQTVVGNRPSMNLPLIPGSESAR
ncbi:MAG TPA: sulfotransferase [Gemmataceae bacterium]|nr:sulfotransferase [Gemmataceae bacterium]